MNNVSNNQNVPFDPDLSLVSETNQKTVNRPDSTTFTGPAPLQPVRSREAHFTPIQDSRNFPTTHNQDSIIMSDSANQSHTPVINNSGFQTHVASPSGTSQFNSNYFLLMLDEIPKIKYSSIETSLSKRVLDDDSNQSMQKLYESIIRSLNIGFSTTLHFLPTFENINSTLSFKTYFLNGLIGSNFDKASNVFTQLGQIIKDRLMHNDCVAKSQCPKAYLILHSYFRMDGWQLLETLFKRRLVNCGALADTDLDLIRVTLMFQPNETIHSFFQRTQELENEYTMQMSRHPHLVPHFKIARRFISEIMRAREYQPYVMDFHKMIVKHNKTHSTQM